MSSELVSLRMSRSLRQAVQAAAMAARMGEQEVIRLVLLTHLPAMTPADFARAAVSYRESQKREARLRAAAMAADRGGESRREQIIREFQSAPW